VLITLLCFFVEQIGILLAEKVCGKDLRRCCRTYYQSPIVCFTMCVITGSLPLTFCGVSFALSYIIHVYFLESTFYTWNATLLTYTFTGSLLFVSTLVPQFAKQGPWVIKGMICSGVKDLMRTRETTDIEDQDDTSSSVSDENLGSQQVLLTVFGQKCSFHNYKNQLKYHVFEDDDDDFSFQMESLKIKPGENGCVDVSGCTKYGSDLPCGSLPESRLPDLQTLAQTCDVKVSFGSNFANDLITNIFFFFGIFYRSPGLTGHGYDIWIFYNFALLPATIVGYLCYYIINDAYIIRCGRDYDPLLNLICPEDATGSLGLNKCCEVVPAHFDIFPFLAGFAASALAAYGAVRYIAIFILAGTDHNSKIQGDISEIMEEQNNMRKEYLKKIEKANCNRRGVELELLLLTKKLQKRDFNAFVTEEAGEKYIECTDDNSNSIRFVVEEGTLIKYLGGIKSVVEELYISKRKDGTFDILDGDMESTNLPCGFIWNLQQFAKTCGIKINWALISQARKIHSEPGEVFVKFTDTDGDTIVLRQEGDTINEYVNDKLAVENMVFFTVDSEGKYRDRGGNGTIPAEIVNSVRWEIKEFFASTWNWELQENGDNYHWKKVGKVNLTEAIDSRIESLKKNLKPKEWSKINQRFGTTPGEDEEDSDTSLTSDEYGLAALMKHLLDSLDTSIDSSDAGINDFSVPESLLPEIRKVENDEIQGEELPVEVKRNPDGGKDISVVIELSVQEASE